MGAELARAACATVVPSGPRIAQGLSSLCLSGAGRLVSTSQSSSGFRDPVLGPQLQLALHEICREAMGEEGKRLAALRDRLQDLILSKVDEAYVNGHPSSRLPHNLNISFAYVEGESVLMGLNKESALSSGSACTSSTLEPSYVIAALGVDSELAHQTLQAKNIPGRSG